MSTQADLIDKQLDHARQAEGAIAAIGFVDAHALLRCELFKQDFIESFHWEVYDTARGLAQSGPYVDLKKIRLELNARKSSVTDAEIGRLVTTSPSPDDLEHYVDIVRRVSIARQARAVLDKAVDRLISDVEPDSVSVLEHAIRKIEKIKEPISPKTAKIEILTLDDLEKSYPQEREPVLDGLIRVGSVMNIIAAPKVGKSFIASNLAFKLATSDNFLGFPIVRKGKTLVVDNELHRETLSQRYRNTREAMKVPHERRGMLEFMPLRGIPCDIARLRESLKHVEPGTYSAIILDAFYKLIPHGVSENDNAQMGGIYTQLEAMANELATAIIVIHHSSKGFQGDKALSDIGAGAGVISRSVDAHVVIRPHEQQGYCVFEALVRSFRQPDPRTIKFDYPIWSLVEEVEAVVAQPKTPGASKREAEEAEHDRVIRDYLTESTAPQTEAAISSATGITKPKVEKSLKRIGAYIAETETNRWGKGVLKWSLDPQYGEKFFTNDKIHNGSNFVF